MSKSQTSAHHLLHSAFSSLPLLILVSCSRPQPMHVSRSATDRGTFHCPSERPGGDPRQLTITEGIDPPRFCENEPGAAYIRVHGTGTRRFVQGPEERTSCAKSPRDKAAPDDCPTIAAGAFGLSLYVTLRARGIVASGPGLGPCYERTGGWEALRYSIFVHDWKDADAAVTLVSEELSRWGIGEPFGVSVEGIACGVLL